VPVTTHAAAHVARNDARNRVAAAPTRCLVVGIGGLVAVDTVVKTVDNDENDRSRVVRAPDTRGDAGRGVVAITSVRRVLLNRNYR